MVEISVRDDSLEVRLEGWSKLWALKSRIRVPIESVRAARHDPEAARGPSGLRMPGTHVPGVITAGTYYSEGEKTFWSVRRPGSAIVVELENASYDRLIVEVRDPAAAIRLIEASRRDGR